MNNRMILFISACGNLILGLLIYGVFFAPEKLEFTSGAFFGGILMWISLNITAISMYSQKRKQKTNGEF